jgi:hypothetical protein
LMEAGLGHMHSSMQTRVQKDASVVPVLGCLAGRCVSTLRV